jgi:hypothetical protein
MWSNKQECVQGSVTESVMIALLQIIYYDNILIKVVGFSVAIVCYYNTFLLLMLQLTKASIIAIAFYQLYVFSFCIVLCLLSLIRMLIFA